MNHNRIINSNWDFDVTIDPNDATSSSIENARNYVISEQMEVDILFRRRLNVWLVQFVSGLCIVFIVTYLMPSAKGLWLVAIVVAGLMLAYIFAHAHYTRRKLQAADARLLAAAEFAKCLDAERKAHNS